MFPLFTNNLVWYRGVTLFGPTVWQEVDTELTLSASLTTAVAQKAFFHGKMIKSVVENCTVKTQSMSFFLYYGMQLVVGATKASIHFDSIAELVAICLTCHLSSCEQAVT